MVHVRQHASQGRRVAQQLVSDHHLWFATRRGDHAPQEGLSGVLIASLLHQDVEHDAMLVDRAPQRL